ncbi:MAG: methylmalonyl Co-A mutase-associated GTPase MeaB [Micromonosporaceae bacterium]
MAGAEPTRRPAAGAEPTRCPAGARPDLAERVRAGDQRAVARAITLIERTDPRVPDLLATLYPAAGRAAVVGVTGPAGSGKSTLVSRLAGHARKRGHTVGVIAIDPSSTFSGGALLGDRIRMLDLAGDSGVFVRSMATRGAVGGLTRAAADAVTVLDASGIDVVFLETVGVGQAEVDVMSMAHTVLVVSVPGLGDGVQALKAGLLEIADVHVVNKADRDGAHQTAKELLEMLRLRRRSAGGWNTPVQLTTAAQDDGVDELLDQLDKHRAWMREHGELERRNRASALARVRWAAADLAERRVGASSPERADPQLRAVVDKVLAHDLDPLTAAAQLLDRTSEGRASEGRVAEGRDATQPNGAP